MGFFVAIFKVAFSENDLAAPRRGNRPLVIRWVLPPKPFVTSARFIMAATFTLHLTAVMLVT